MSHLKQENIPKIIPALFKKKIHTAVSNFYTPKYNYETFGNILLSLPTYQPIFL